MEEYLGQNQSQENEGISKSVNYITISGNSKYMAGIAGNNSGIIMKSSNLGDVSAINNGSYVGGIAGLSKGSEAESLIQSCYNKGNIASLEEIAGGIAGNNQGKINSCYNTGTIKANKQVGGIAGYSNRMIQNSYNIGEIKSFSLESTNLGGIIGRIGQFGVVNCYNEGNIIFKETDIVGGIIGYVLDETTQLIINNNHYLSTIEKGIGYIKVEKENYTIKEENKMDTNLLLNLLNTGTTYWKKDEENINGGYPILEWESN